jgi:hypothetical protein
VTSRFREYRRRFVRRSERLFEDLTRYSEKVVVVRGIIRSIRSGMLV